MENPCALEGELGRPALDVEDIQPGAGRGEVEGVGPGIRLRSGGEGMLPTAGERSEYVNVGVASGRQAGSLLLQPQPDPAWLADDRQESDVNETRSMTGGMGGRRGSSAISISKQWTIRGLSRNTARSKRPGRRNCAVVW